MSVDLPEPEGPTRKTNSPFSMWNVASSMPGTFWSYIFVTFSKRIRASP